MRRALKIRWKIFIVIVPSCRANMAEKDAKKRSRVWTNHVGIILSLVMMKVVMCLALNVYARLVMWALVVKKKLRLVLQRLASMVVIVYRAWWDFANVLMGFLGIDVSTRLHFVITDRVEAMVFVNWRRIISCVFVMRDGMARCVIII
jgi:hypothetical protein